MKTTKTLVTILVLSFASQAFSQTITARTSQLNYFANYGHGGDLVINTSDDVSWNDLEQNSAKTLNYADSISGTYLSAPWTASVDIALSHSYSILGSMSNFEQVDVQMRSDYFATWSGAAGAGAGGQSVLPGNLLELEFTVATPFDFEFMGTASYNSNGAAPHARAELQRWTGTTWAMMESSIFNNGVLRTGTLNTGTYRLYVTGEVKSLVDTQIYADTTLYFRNLDAVPEPTSMGLLGLGGLAVLRKRRK